MRRRWLLSVVVVGGGFSGVEVAGELNDLLRGSLRFFPNLERDDVRVTLVHSRDQLLPEIAESLRLRARRKLERAGVHMELETRVAGASVNGVTLADGRQLPAGTLVCTIGSAPAELVQGLDAEQERGRLRTERDLRLVGRDHAWAIGDCAWIETGDGSPCPTTAQFAYRQGRHVARNLLATLKGGKPAPFAFEPLGQLCAVGGRSAVGEVLGLRLSGFPAWVLWRLVYLTKLPSFSRRLRVGFDWMWQALFARDLFHVRAERTDRVMTASFEPGQYVFRQGDPSVDFYAIRSGEVEVLRATDDGDETIATLGPGEFFGEMALVSEGTRNASVRARTRVEVVHFGKQTFRQLTSTLSGFDLLVQDAARRRARSHPT